MRLHHGGKRRSVERDRPQRRRRLPIRRCAREPLESAMKTARSRKVSRRRHNPDGGDGDSTRTQKSLGSETMECIRGKRRKAEYDEARNRNGSASAFRQRGNVCAGRNSGNNHLIPRPHVEAGGVRVAGLHQASPTSERHVSALAGWSPVIADSLAFELTRNLELVGWLNVVAVFAREAGLANVEITDAPLATDCRKAVRPTNVVGVLRLRTPARPRDRPAPESAPPTSRMRSGRSAGLPKVSR